MSPSSQSPGFDSKKVHLLFCLSEDLELLHRFDHSTQTIRQARYQVYQSFSINPTVAVSLRPINRISTPRRNAADGQQNQLQHTPQQTDVVGTLDWTLATLIYNRKYIRMLTVYFTEIQCSLMLQHMVWFTVKAHLPSWIACTIIYCVGPIRQQSVYFTGIYCMLPRYTSEIRQAVQYTRADGCRCPDELTVTWNMVDRDIVDPQLSSLAHNIWQCTNLLILSLFH